MSFASVAGHVFICLCQEATRQKLIRILIKTSQSIEYTSVKIYIMHGCYSRGRFKDRHEISNIRALIFQYLLCFNVWIKYTSFHVWVGYLMWNFKQYLWNSTQNILPIHWKIYLLYIVKILKSLLCILKCPLVYLGMRRKSYKNSFYITGPLSSVDSPNKGPVMWSLVFYLLLTWSFWTNNRVARVLWCLEWCAGFNVSIRFLVPFTKFNIFQIDRDMEFRRQIWWISVAPLSILLAPHHQAHKYVEPCSVQRIHHTAMQFMEWDSL